MSRFVRGGDTILVTFVEVESGRNSSRPQLAAALEKCRQLGAVLLIAKLDRLACDVAFIATLMKSDVRFVACDMPEADPFRLHIEAAIAEEETRKISARTKAALAAAKARGVRLGGFRGHQLSRDLVGPGRGVEVGVDGTRGPDETRRLVCIRTLGLACKAARRSEAFWRVQEMGEEYGQFPASTGVDRAAQAQLIRAGIDMASQRP